MAQERPQRRGDQLRGGRGRPAADRGGARLQKPGGAEANVRFQRVGYFHRQGQKRQLRQQVEVPPEEFSGAVSPLVQRPQETEDGAAMQPDDFPEIDTRTASVARVYDFMLGGTDNYEVDRQACELLEDMMPGSYAMTRNNRRYLERLVHYLAAARGIRQFIDNGSGLPTQNNVHQVAQQAAPGSKVVYVD